MSTYSTRQRESARIQQDWSFAIRQKCLIERLLFSLPPDMPCRVFLPYPFSSIHIEVPTRDDLATIKTICTEVFPGSKGKVWNKVCGTNASQPCVTYAINLFDGDLPEKVCLFVEPEELPPTCTRKTITVTEPATEEKTYKHVVIDCGADDKEPTAETTTTPVA